MEIKRGCIYCGCEREKIQKINSGPIIKVRCPECGYVVNQGENGIITWDALVKKWNGEYDSGENVVLCEKDYDESVVRSAWNIVKYCKQVKECRECIFVKSTSYRKTFNRCPFDDGGKRPKEWKPPFVDNL